MPTDEKCGLCDHDPACGFAKHGDTRYCHGDDETHDCYAAWEAQEWEDIFDSMRTKNIQWLGK